MTLNVRTLKFQDTCLKKKSENVVKKVFKKMEKVFQDRSMLLPTDAAEQPGCD